MDYNNLSKEELIKLLKKEIPTETKEENVGENGLYGKCKYVSTRGPKKECTKIATVPYGFCTIHKNTIQAKTERGKYESSKQKTEPSPPPEVEKEAEQPLTEVDLPKKKEPQEKPPVKKKEETSKSEPVKKVKMQPPPKLRVRKNKWGNFEHKETSMVFNPLTRKACGVQLASGHVRGIGSEEVKICAKYNWDYEIISDSESEDDDMGKTEEEDSDQGEEDENPEE
jgi:hypothetical protein